MPSWWLEELGPKLVRLLTLIWISMMAAAVIFGAAVVGAIVATPILLASRGNTTDAALIAILNELVRGISKPSELTTPPKYTEYNGKLLDNKGNVIVDVLTHGFEVARTIPLGLGETKFGSTFTEAFTKSLGEKSGAMPIEAIKEVGKTIWDKLTGGGEKKGIVQTTIQTVNVPPGLSKADLDDIVTHVVERIRVLIPVQPPRPPGTIGDPPPPRPIAQTGPSPITISFSRIGSFDGPEVDATIAATIPEVLKVLRSYERCIVTLSGHTDTIGSNSLNNDLSLKRVRHVSARFAQSGIVVAIQEAWGPHHLQRLTGEEVDDATNRRVEVSFACTGPS